MRGILRGVEVIELAEVLVEPVDGGQVLVEVAEMVLAELARGIALALSAVAMVSRAGIPILAPAWPTVVMPVRIGTGR